MADSALVLAPGRELRLVRDGEVPAHRRASAVSASAAAGLPRGASAPAGGSLRDLRLTRRGWWVLSLVAVLLVVAGMVVGDRAFASAPAEAVSVTEHYVAQGETLWKIARTVALPGEDTRDVVEMLVELNGRSSASLQVGEQLLLPVR